MSKKSRLGGIVWAMLLALVFSGSGLHTIATAMGAPVSAQLYAVSALSAALAALAATSIVGGIAAAALGVGGVGAYIATHSLEISNLRTFLTQWQREPLETAQMATGGRALLLCAAALSGVLFFALLYRRELASTALVLLGAMIVSSHAMSQTASIAAAVPGLVAAAVSFAFGDKMPRDISAARVLVPAGLAALLALTLLPADRVTWTPMEDLASRVRSVFEQYFNFTHERIAFSLGEVGYNRGGEVNGEVVAMLGGPAQPDTNPVMRVTVDGEALLRGTIRATYTGYSWVDVAPKNRYLYYDLTHRAVRARVFDQVFKSPSGAFRRMEGEVEMLNSGTSTLFTPGRLNDFRMALSNAVYYNSTGEMFMARTAQAGDAYAFTAFTPIYGDALKQATLSGADDADTQYASIVATHSALPEGIDPALYRLTQEIIADAQTPYDRARVIETYLRRNMRYRLDVAYPPTGRDFASWFVLDSHEGYCSYFATAMAVMGRMAGLPTRYVEGYYARPGADGAVVLTGQDAHAWAEVYFRGVGWLPFDATNGGPASADGEGEGAGEADYTTEADTEGDGGESAEDEDASGSLPDAPTPSPQPMGDGGGEMPDAPDMTAQKNTPPEGERQNSSHFPVWAVLSLLLLLLIALAVGWICRQLMQTNPARLCGQTRRAQDAAMMLYRANLTLLMHMGQAPNDGETPEAFIGRVSKAFNNSDYARFVQAVAANRYARRPIKREDVEAGLRAYQRFKRGMRRAEALRFAVTRVTRGLGDFDSIP